jgi:hypothetical protein
MLPSMTSAKLLASAALLFVVITLSCGGSSEDLCSCTPDEPASKDYRHTAKHVSMPAQTPQDVQVSTILDWPQPGAPANDAPRKGRELQLFQVARAFLQSTHLNPGDCDLHFEISQVASKTAPRVIVETPGDPEYCAARQNIQSQLAGKGIRYPSGGELDPAVPVSVTGLAFQDFEHNRGSSHVATTWELHPAIVTVLP